MSHTNPFEDLSYAEITAELNKQMKTLPVLSNFEKVKEFNRLFQRGEGKWPPSQESVTLHERLITEEFTEFKKELHDLDFVRVKTSPDKKKVAKELADLLYVAYDTAVAFDIDIDRVFDEVHKSNLSKLSDEGTPILRDDGKILKGPNYQEPQLEFIF